MVYSKKSNAALYLHKKKTESQFGLPLCGYKTDKNFTATELQYFHN